jgi:V/A-type H+-transporting ATPase subunit B
MRGVEYRGLSRIEGPVIITERSRNVGFNEVVAV